MPIFWQWYILCWQKYLLQIPYTYTVNTKSRKSKTKQWEKKPDKTNQKERKKLTIRSPQTNLRERRQLQWKRTHWIMTTDQTGRSTVRFVSVRHAIACRYVYVNLVHWLLGGNIQADLCPPVLYHSHMMVSSSSTNIIIVVVAVVVVKQSLWQPQRYKFKQTQFFCYIFVRPFQGQSANLLISECLHFQTFQFLSALPNLSIFQKKNTFLYSHLIHAYLFLELFQ